MHLDVGEPEADTVASEQDRFEVAAVRVESDADTVATADDLTKDAAANVDGQQGDASLGLAAGDAGWQKWLAGVGALVEDVAGHVQAVRAFQAKKCVLLS